LDEEDSITHDGIHVIYLYKIMENEIYENKNSIFFLYFQYEENYLFITNSPPNSPPSPFSLIFGEKKKACKKSCK
jgi:hypothetical protein